MSQEPPRLTFAQQIRSFPGTFWVANVIELIERFSFWGVRPIAVLYILAPLSEGGLGLTNTDKGIFFGVWALIQCLLPMFTGGFSDRYGYRVSLIVAFCFNMAGYGLMGFMHTWWGFMVACCLVGTGTAIFKPPLHGTLAHCVDQRNSSVGWGIFYNVVNIGAAIGPFVMGGLRRLDWRYAFVAAASVIILNFIATVFALKDYAKETKQDASRGPGRVLIEALTTLRDVRFALFLGIMSGFWFMFMQLSDQLVVHIKQWVDSSDVVRTVTWITGAQGVEKYFAKYGGQINPEWLYNVDAVSIVFLVVLVCYFTGKLHPIVAITLGMGVSCFGLLLCSSATTGWFCVFGVFIFALGEMGCSPKFTEYVGLMAPREKKALYLGYSNIPFAVGWSGANFVGGPLYDRFSDKFELARRYMVQQLHLDGSTVAALDKGEVMGKLTEALNLSERAASELLWQEYNPRIYWYLCIGLGVLSTMAMVVYHFWLRADAERRQAAAPKGAANEASG